MSDSPLPEITPEFHRHLQMLAHTVEVDAESCMSMGQWGRLAQIVHAKCDSELTQIRDRLPSVKLDCKASCDACCYRGPLATIPELLHILDVIERSFGQEERLALFARTEGYARSGDPCPLLSNGLCSVYNSRPLSCRGINSIDSGPCQKWRTENPPHDLPIFQHQDAVGEAATFGLRAALLWQGLDHEMVDLALALKWALSGSQPATELADNYRGGKSLPEAVRRPIAGDPLQRPAYVEEGKPALTAPNQISPTGLSSRREHDSLKQFYDSGLRSGEFEQAVASLDLSIPSHAMAAIVVPRVYREESEIPYWREHFVNAMRAFRDAEFSKNDKFNSLSIHRSAGLAYQGMDDLAIMREHGQILAEITTAALPELTMPIGRSHRPGKRRLGYLSANMHSNNGCRWALGWLKRHDPSFETFALNVGTIEDAVSRQFRATADHYFHLVRSIVENALFIKSLALDALIITDIGLHGFNTAYATMRLAPVQCTAWGHPVTSGFPDIDYYLSSALMEPENGQSHYSEKLVLLPGSGLSYQPIESFMPLDRRYFGLQDEGPLIVNVQTKPKLLPQHDVLYAQIAERAKVPVVFLNGFHDCDTLITKARMERAGVRSIWLPHLKRSEFLALLQLADVSLDPPLWSGGNTTIESLAVGTPVVTLPGPWMRSRHSVAFLEQSNGSGLVAKDEIDYVNIACDFVRQREIMEKLEPGSMFLDDQPAKALDRFLDEVT